MKYEKEIDELKLDKECLEKNIIDIKNEAIEAIVERDKTLLEMNNKIQFYESKLDKNDKKKMEVI